MNLPPITEVILKSAQDGDQGAISFILTSVRPLCVNLIRKMRIKAVDFEDVVQDTVITTLNCIKKYKSSEGVFEGFVNGAVMNMLRDRHEANKYRRVLELNEVADNRSWGELEHLEVLDAMRGLPEHQQCLIMEHYGIDSREYSITELESTTPGGAFIFL